jgi:hypothetical protein
MTFEAFKVWAARFARSTRSSKASRFRPPVSDALFGDAYGVQHHGEESRQAIQSIAIHLLNVHGIIAGKTTRPSWATSSPTERPACSKADTWTIAGCYPGRGRSLRMNATGP